MRGPGSVFGIATGYELDGPGIESRWGARFSAPVHTGPGAHPASCTMDTGSFPGVKCGRGVTLTSHPFLLPWSRKSRAIPLFPIWAVRPVQSLSDCTRVHFTLLLHRRKWELAYDPETVDILCCGSLRLEKQASVIYWLEGYVRLRAGVGEGAKREILSPYRELKPIRLTIVPL